MSDNGHAPELMEELLDLALEEYCKWVSKWCKASEIEEEYFPTVESFRVFDPERGLYGETVIYACVEVGRSEVMPRIMLHASVFNGDNGGPAELTAFFEGNMSKDEWNLIYMLQHFDTNIAEIYNMTETKQGRGFQNVP